jgi:hypothetical protein
LADLPELGLFRILVQSAEEVLVDNEVLITLGVVDLDVGEIGMHAKGKVGGEGPGRGRPCEEGGFGVINQRECDSH